MTAVLVDDKENNEPFTPAMRKEDTWNAILKRKTHA
jgi:hypothetical protein